MDEYSARVSSEVVASIENRWSEIGHLWRETVEDELTDLLLLRSRHYRVNLWGRVRVAASPQGYPSPKIICMIHDQRGSPPKFRSKD
jgi:hypothetical protein